MRKYSDAQLISAVPVSRSWRGVLQRLGLKGTSAGSLRAVRGHADRLGLDYSHFTGQRRWADADLTAAVAAADSWSDVAARLGLSSAGGNTLSTLRHHSLRLGLDANHLAAASVPVPDETVLAPSVANLRKAGVMMAAAWFELCGRPVAWPLEPVRYDLLVWRDDGPRRIQVKTTTRRSASTWTVQLRTNRKATHTYGPDEIDDFFVVDGDYVCYLIPLKTVGGFSAINLARYAAYRLPWVKA